MGVITPSHLSCTVLFHRLEIRKQDSAPLHILGPLVSIASRSLQRQRPTKILPMEELSVFELGFDIDCFGSNEAQTHLDVKLYIYDTRCTMELKIPNTLGNIDEDDDLAYALIVKAASALCEYLDNRAPAAGDLPQTFGIKIDETGTLLSIKIDPVSAGMRQTGYYLLEEYQLPPRINSKTVLRSELTEIRRLFHRVDLVDYSSSLFPTGPEHSRNKVVFKYDNHKPDKVWTEIQILARLPPHPHLALLDRLVLDEPTGSHVVGFTMRYIANEPLVKSRPAFKLKWLRQLMQTIDDLNLKYGIIHQDVAHRNLIIDPDSDSIVLIDFNFASRLGLPISTSISTEGTREGRDDVKGVAAFVYEYITRDPALGQQYDLGEVDESSVMDSARWVKHPSVELDAEVAEFYSELKTWIRQRRTSAQLTHYTQAPEYLEWPSAPKHPTGRSSKRRKKLFLNWARPPSAQVDPTRRLLATGRYADEEEASQAEQQTFATQTRKSFRRRGDLSIVMPDLYFINPVPPGHRVLRSAVKRKEDAADTDRATAAPSRPAKKRRGKHAGKVQGRKA